MLEFSRLFSANVRTWLVLALCLLIVGALAAIFLFNVPVSNLLLVLVALACPLSHLLLGHGGHSHSAEAHDGQLAGRSAGPRESISHRNRSHTHG